MGRALQLAWLLLLATAGLACSSRSENVSSGGGGAGAVSSGGSGLGGGAVGGGTGGGATGGGGTGGVDGGGIGGAVDGGGTGGEVSCTATVPVYRFVSQEAGSTHCFPTTCPALSDCAGYLVEFADASCPVDFKLLVSPAPGLVPVYRCRTADSSVRVLVKNASQCLAGESDGVVGYMGEAASICPATLEIWAAHRFNPEDYLYGSKAEVEPLLGNGWFPVDNDNPFGYAVQP